MGASQWDTVNFNKFKAWNICITSFAIGIRPYLNIFEIGA